MGPAHIRVGERVELRRIFGTGTGVVIARTDRRLLVRWGTGASRRSAKRASAVCVASTRSRNVALRAQFHHAARASRSCARIRVASRRSPPSLRAVLEALPDRDAEPALEEDPGVLEHAVEDDRRHLPGFPI